MPRKTIKFRQNRYKVPHFPQRLTRKQGQEYEARTPVVEKELDDLMPKPSIVIDAEYYSGVTTYYEMVFGITLPLMERLLYSFADVVYGGDEIGFEYPFDTTVGEVMAFMAAYEGCTLNAVAEHVIYDGGNPDGVIKTLYITSMVYTGQTSEEFWADFRRLMPLKWNPYRNEFLILANNDDETDRR